MLGLSRLSGLSKLAVGEQYGLIGLIGMIGFEDLRDALGLGVEAAAISALVIDAVFLATAEEKYVPTGKR